MSEMTTRTLRDFYVGLAGALNALEKLGIEPTNMQIVMPPADFDRMFEAHLPLIPRHKQPEPGRGVVCMALMDTLLVKGEPI